MTILGLLRQKHSRDVFVSECKDGPSQCTSHLRLDAWAMNKSWADPITTGYEIKESRTNFVNDTKWHNYLPLCNEFYFVCPAKLINPLELPPEAGLIYASRTFTKLFTKKKAPRRVVAIPESLYRYILMCRTTIAEENGYDKHRGSKDYWELWLKEKKLDTDFGYSVSKSIRQFVDEQVHKVDKENQRLIKEIEVYQNLKEFLRSIGYEFDAYDRWGTGYYIKEKMKKLLSAVPEDLEYKISGLESSLALFRKELAELKSKDNLELQNVGSIE